MINLPKVPPTHTHTIGAIRKIKYKYCRDAAPKLGSEMLWNQTKRMDWGVCPVSTSHSGCPTGKIFNLNQAECFGFPQERVCNHDCIYFFGNRAIALLQIFNILLPIQKNLYVLHVNELDYLCTPCVCFIKRLGLQQMGCLCICCRVCSTGSIPNLQHPSYVPHCWATAASDEKVLQVCLMVVGVTPGPWDCGSPGTALLSSLFLRNLDSCVPCATVLLWACDGFCKGPGGSQGKGLFGLLQLPLPLHSPLWVCTGAFTTLSKKI